MAEKEKNFGERAGETVRNLGVVGGLIGIVAAIAGLRFGGELFVKSAVVGVAGEAGKRVAGSGKKQ